MGLEKILIQVDSASPGTMAVLTSSELAALVAEIKRLRGIVVDARIKLSALLDDLI